MARPNKIGLDYFPLDVHLEDGVELLEAEFGLEGYAILIKLWQKIYSEGYFIEWSQDNALLFARKINVDANLVNSVVNGCLRRNLFNKIKYKEHSILTSSGIQKRYDEVCTRAKRKNVTYNPSFLLIKTQFTTEEMPQRKEKKKREEKNTELDVAIDEFKKHRKQLKKPMTDRAVSLFTNKLDGMADTDEEKIALINTAIERGWQTVYEDANKKQTQSVNIGTIKSSITVEESFKPKGEY